MADDDLDQVEAVRELPAWVRERREMNEAEWLAESHLVYPISFLCKRREHRKVRLFAGACCRRVWNLLVWDAAKRVVDLSDAYADGEVTEAELRLAHADPEFDNLELQFRGEAEANKQLSMRVLEAINAARFLGDPYYERSDGAHFVAQDTALDPAGDYHPKYHKPGRGIMSDDVARAEQLKLLHEIVGNPFRRDFDARWCSDAAVGVASKMYHERDFSDMPILGDALEEAGCDNVDILGHCRNPAVHVRGCWVVDWVLGRS